MTACPMVRATGCIDDAVADPDVPHPDQQQGERLMGRHPYAGAMPANEGSDALAPLLAPSVELDSAAPSS